MNSSISGSNTMIQNLKPSMINIQSPASIYGYTIFQYPLLTETEEREKSIKERWFSWPWKPWRKTKYTQVASKKIYIDKIGMRIYIHPNFYKTVIEPYITKAKTQEDLLSQMILKQFQENN